MAEVTMPRLSDTMSEGTVGRWLKKPGDKIETGEVIAEIETDKATMELQSFESGTLQKILIPEGQTVPIGEVIDVRSLRPLDRPTLIESVKKTSRAVVVEEDWYSYGVGAELVATIQEGAFDYLDAPIRRVAQAEVPLPYAKVMEQAALPKAQNIVEAIKGTLEASGYRARSFA